MRYRILTTLLVLLLGASVALTQTATTGQISGDVTDPTGAIVLGAKLTVTSDAGLQRTATSDAAGHYIFALLPPGMYKLQVSAPGFNVLTLENIAVSITQTALVNVSLKVEMQKETVVVSAATPLVQTENASTGRVIEQASVRQLPLPTRNFQQLLTLTTGTSGSLQNSSELGRGDAVVNVNGQRTTSNAVIINGVDANSVGTGSTPNLAVPATDSMQEFIVQTSLYDASQGRSVGGVIAAVTKSGTDKFHGNLYEFLRNTSLNANNFFLNRTGVPKPRLDRNQFGATFGGPIKPGRAWFFISYQGTREKNGASLLNSLSTVVVPQNLPQTRTDATLLQLYTDNFGALAPFFYNPNSPQVKLLKATLPDGSFVIPSPATTTVGSLAQVPVSIPKLSRFREDQVNLNLDLKLGEYDRVGLKFFGANNPTKQALYSFAGSQNPIQAPGFGADLNINQRLFSAEETHVFGPSFINVAKFGGSNVFARSIPSEPLTGADVGIANPLSSLFPGMPTISLSNMMDVGISPLSDNVSEVWTYTASDMATWTRGKHTFKFGGDLKFHKSDLVFNAYTRGQAFFLGTTPAQVFQNFLLGVPGLTIIGSGVPDRNNRAHDFDFFFQDDWRLLPRLTLNLGLRYDYYGPFTEDNGRFVAFDPTLATTAPWPTGGVSITGGFVQAGNGTLTGVPKVQDALVDADRNNLGPRFGFAYQPFKNNHNVVVRGGYGVYYDRANARLLNSQVFNSPYYTIAMNAAGAFTVAGTTYVFWPSFSDPFVHVDAPSTYPKDITTVAPAVLPINPLLTNPVFPVPLATATVSAAGIYPNRQNFRTPYIQQYNFGVQMGLHDHWLLDLAYVGSTGHKLTRLRSLNQAPSPGLILNGQYSPGLSALALPVFGTYAVESSSNSNYNSLQASLTKRLSRGLQFLMSYTYAHSIDNYSGTDVSDLSVVPGNQATLANTRATSDYDRRQRVVTSFTYDFPKAYNGGSKLADRVLNHWQMAGIVTLQTGVPFSILGDATAFTQTRANLAAGQTFDASVCGDGSAKSRLGEYFDTSAFVRPTTFGDFGQLPRNICRGPGQRNMDFSLVKFIPVTESQQVEFRTEFFNIFNTTNFANPVNIVSAATFGQIVRTSTGPRVIQFALKYNF